MRQRIGVALCLLLFGAGVLDAQPRASYTVTLRTVPAKPRAGQVVDLRLTAVDRQGLPITAFDTVHERPLHLIIVSQDLSEFSHLHPAYDGRGTFQTRHRFEAGGAYRLFADLQPSGLEAAPVPVPLAVAGGPSFSVPLGPDRMDFVSSEEDVRIALRTSERPTAGRPVRLTFDVKDARTGTSVDDLEPYLGSRVHVIIVRAGSLDLLHVHQAESRGPEVGGDHHGQHHTLGASTEATAVGTLTAETRFPSAGRYKIWAQLQRKGRVITASFVLTVAST